MIFNVKGEDLLFLDEPNRRLADEEGRWQGAIVAGRPATNFWVCPLAPSGAARCMPPPGNRGVVRP